ncbi:hypothetical protein RI367_001596 [Sorochytrium milnesiophthora]
MSRRISSAALSPAMFSDTDDAFELVNDLGCTCNASAVQSLVQTTVPDLESKVADLELRLGTVSMTATQAAVAEVERLSGHCTAATAAMDQVKCKLVLVVDALKRRVCVLERRLADQDAQVAATVAAESAKREAAMAKRLAALEAMVADLAKAAKSTASDSRKAPAPTKWASYSVCDAGVSAHPHRISVATSTVATPTLHKAVEVNIARQHEQQYTAVQVSFNGHDTDSPAASPSSARLMSAAHAESTFLSSLDASFHLYVRTLHNKTPALLRLPQLDSPDAATTATATTAATVQQLKHKIAPLLMHAYGVDLPAHRQCLVHAGRVLRNADSVPAVLPAGSTLIVLQKKDVFSPRSYGDE